MKDSLRSETRSCYLDWKLGAMIGALEWIRISIAMRWSDDDGRERRDATHRE